MSELRPSHRLAVAREKPNLVKISDKTELAFLIQIAWQIDSSNSGSNDGQCL